MAALIIIAIFLIAPFFVTHPVGKSKNRTGWNYGIFGWIGVIVLLLQGPKNPQVTAQGEVLSAKQREVAELEAEVRLAELRKRQAELADA